MVRDLAVVHILLQPPPNPPRLHRPPLQHGRVKVRTSAEQEEIKRRERQEKLAAYLALRNAIFAKVSPAEPTEK